MTYTVRIYGPHPEAGPDSLLCEHDDSDAVETLLLIAAALRDGYTAELLATERHEPDRDERWYTETCEAREYKCCDGTAPPWPGCLIRGDEADSPWDY